MDIKQAGGGLGLFAGIAAGAALVRWPFNLVAEAIMTTAALLAAATLVAWLIGLFYERINTAFQRVTLLTAGSLLGIYLATTGAYFGGYIGYNYPASQERLAAQSKQIAALTASLDTTAAALASTQSQLGDAKKAMIDPRSVTAPAYNLDTSLKLQFDNTSAAQAIEARNVTWVAAPVREAVEIQPPPAAPPPNCSGGILADPACASGSRYLLNLQPQCPAPGPTYETSNALLLVLTFPYPVQASEIKLEPHGAVLPENNILALNERSAVIMFDKNLRNTVLDIVISQPRK